jgi:hypothetical protein
MCHFITATLPESACHEALNALARKFGRQFQPLASPAVAARLPDGSAYFLTTLAHCDCGTVLGSAYRVAARAPDWAAEEAKLFKKGWSRGKVARALEQRRKSNVLKQEALAGEGTPKGRERLRHREIADGLSYAFKAKTPQWKDFVRQTKEST